MSQSTNSVLMIEPVAFGFNVQTAGTNYFQVNDESTDTQTVALEQFTSFVEKLRNKGVNVITVNDTLTPHTPDSIFPNNWVSFHEDGTIILYPMCAENRRLERRMDILGQLTEKGFHISAIKDYSIYEAEGKFLEGTGSMILDRVNRIAYGAVSLRLNEEIFAKWCSQFCYQPIVFHSFQYVNGRRLPIYHTNVMMCVASEFALICLDSIDNKMERELVKKTLTDCHKEIIEISEDQLNCYAGNSLEVKNDVGKKILVMSECAYRCLTAKQIQTIEKHSEIVYSNLQAIEKSGGGSARCCMAEIFLPKTQF